MSSMGQTHTSYHHHHNRPNHPRTVTMWGLPAASACTRWTSSAACTVMMGGRRNSQGLMSSLLMLYSFD